MIHFLSEVTMNKEICDFLADTFLFANFDLEDIEFLLQNSSAELVEYNRGDTIYSPEDFDKKLGFVYSGECLVSRPGSTSNVPLNLLKKHSSFGITAVFSKEESFPTIVTAKTNCSVLFIKSDDLLRFIDMNKRVSLNIIYFLTQRISFLNEKIATFSGGTIEEKLVNYLLTKRRQAESDKFIFNKKQTAEALNCGRASLYRALTLLENEGYISFDEKNIIINDPDGLERIIK